MNPVAKTGLLSALARVVAGERLRVPKPYLERVAQASQGDVRSAVHMLQFDQLGPPQHPHKANAAPDRKAAAAGQKRNKKRKVHAGTEHGSGSDGEGPEEQWEEPRSRARNAVGSEDNLDDAGALGGRDPMYGVFRALGKVLHAKEVV
jgi:hypothetical protein